VPSKEDHQELADHNQDLIDHLVKSGNSFADWVCTVAFYKALHVVEAVFDHIQSYHAYDHSSREEALKRENRYSKICTHYLALKEASQIARYLKTYSGKAHHHRFSDYLSMDGVKTDILAAQLAPLETSAAKLLRPPPQKKKGKK